MCIWPSQKIREWALAGGCEPFTPENVNPASLDVTWSGRFRFQTTKTESGWSSSVYEQDTLELKRLQLVLLDTTEYIKIPGYVSVQLQLKSSLARLGINHAMAGFGEAGFQGTYTLEVYSLALSSVMIHKGQRLAQLIFHQMLEIPESLYDGHYKGQAGPTEAWAKAW